MSAPRGDTGGLPESRTGNTVPEAGVASMFDSIAPVYDRMNTLMTGGLDGGCGRRGSLALLDDQEDSARQAGHVQQDGDEEKGNPG